MSACSVGLRENAGTGRQIVLGWLEFSSILTLKKNERFSRVSFCKFKSED